MKELGYLIFAICYHICCLFKIEKNKVCAIMHHDTSEFGNIGVVLNYLDSMPYRYNIVYITKKDIKSISGKGVIKNFIPFFIGKAYALATSQYILQDDIFLPMSYLKIRKGVKNIQLWHGTGTIKKFGQDVNVGRLKYLEKKANSNITHLIVNSKNMIEQYSCAFGIAKDKVCVYGLPRTDFLFNKAKMLETQKKFFNKYEELKGKKIVLYAPTFRDEEVESPNIKLDIDKFLKITDDNTVLFLRLHPFVAKNYLKNIKESNNYANRVYEMSKYPNLNELLVVADCLVTDYSSIIFEYCLLEKPIIFYAYDLDKFYNQGRGFYERYEDFVPGVVVKDSEELAYEVNKNVFDRERVERFKKENYDYLDGHSTTRVINKIFLT